MAALVRNTPTPSENADLSIVLPASNEAGEIGECLDSILRSDWSAKASVDCIVVANGCSDATADIARQRVDAFQARGWNLTVLDIAEGGKLNALNLGDRTATSGNRIYIDADVRLSPLLLQQIHDVLQTEEARYTSGTCEISLPNSWVSRAYRRIYSRVPFMTHGVPGCGIFAVNEPGRARWKEFPNIISDDTFVRLSFTPEERVGVTATYEWPVVEGWGNLVKVRRRQERGVDEIKEKFPNLLSNDDKLPFPVSDKLRMALGDPIGFAVYTGVRIAARLTQSQKTNWSRGR